MKTSTIKSLGAAAALGLFLAVLDLPAQESGGVERVTRKDGKVMIVKGGSSAPLEKEITLPHDIKVMTNGTFTVKGGKSRELKEGQVLNKDGTLLNTDGSIMPVMDHVTLKNGRVVLVKDGESATVDKELVLGNGTRVAPDGTVTAKDGRRTRLLDGQLLELGGAVLPAKDTITLQNGKVMVQKDGSMLSVQPGQTLMMSDGTKVFGDGTILLKDGKKVTLSEGQILTVEGVVRIK